MPDGFPRDLHFKNYRFPKATAEGGLQKADGFPRDLHLKNYRFPRATIEEEPHNLTRLPLGTCPSTRPSSSRNTF